MADTRQPRAPAPARFVRPRNPSLSSIIRSELDRSRNLGGFVPTLPSPAFAHDPGADADAATAMFATDSPPYLVADSPPLPASPAPKYRYREPTYCHEEPPIYVSTLVRSLRGHNDKDSSPEPDPPADGCGTMQEPYERIHLVLITFLLWTVFFTLHHGLCPLVPYMAAAWQITPSHAAGIAHDADTVFVVGMVLFGIVSDRMKNHRWYMVVSGLAVAGITGTVAGGFVRAGYPFTDTHGRFVLYAIAFSGHVAMPPSFNLVTLTFNRNGDRIAVLTLIGLSYPVARMLSTIVFTKFMADADSPGEGIGNVLLYIGVTCLLLAGWAAAGDKRQPCYVTAEVRNLERTLVPPYLAPAYPMGVLVIMAALSPDTKNYEDSAWIWKLCFLATAGLLCFVGLVVMRLVANRSDVGRVTRSGVSCGFELMVFAALVGLGAGFPVYRRAVLPMPAAARMLEWAVLAAVPWLSLAAIWTMGMWAGRSRAPTVMAFSAFALAVGFLVLSVDEGMPFTTMGRGFGMLIEQSGTDLAWVTGLVYATNGSAYHDLGHVGGLVVTATVVAQALASRLCGAIHYSDDGPSLQRTIFVGWLLAGFVAFHVNLVTCRHRYRPLALKTREGQRSRPALRGTELQGWSTSPA